MSYYNKTRDKLRAKQKSLQEKLGKLQIADEEYYLTSNYILDLARRAPELYESSEPIKKRQLLKFTLQNLQLEGSLALYDEVKPFSTILKYADNELWLPLKDLFINRELEFDHSLDDFKILSSNLVLY